MFEIWETDIRSCKTGNSIECICSGNYDEAWNTFEEWYKNNPSVKEKLEANSCLTWRLVDGSDGVFVDCYLCDSPDMVHGVGMF